VADLFSRKVRREHEQLKDKYEHLEDKYEHLQSEHDKLREETGEQTNMRISYIEEEIESMNKRVEKLASDSYAIHSEVRDIHESVKGMQASLSDIVKLYKAILMQYGFGKIQLDPSKGPAPKKAAAGEVGPPTGREPGDDIIRALEQRRSRGEDGGRPPPPPVSRTVPPKPHTPARPSASATPRSPPPPPSTAPATTSGSSALDELHRLSEEQRAREALEGETVADRLASRAGSDDRVTRVARREMGRMDTVDRGGEGEFTRSLPKKDRTPKRTPAEARDGGWEALGGAPADEGDERAGRKERKRVTLDDLLSPE
jgi:hypothetical protein